VEIQILSTVISTTIFTPDYVLAATTLSDDIKTMTNAVSLTDTVTLYLTIENADQIQWSDFGPSLYVTRNFLHTIHPRK